MIAFWILAPLMVLAAVGMVLSRKAVHSALYLAVVMVGLAILYAVQDAPFLSAVQVVVYTGAVLMLFLFVLMLVGVDSSDSLVETIRGQRWPAVVLAVGFTALLVTGLGQSTVAITGLADANAAGNVPALAQLLFDEYVLAFEATSALLITAALGAMVLTHRERLSPKARQRELARERFLRYAEDGRHPGVLPSPGVFARHNAIGTPALLPDGTPARASVSRALAARGDGREEPPPDDVRETVRELGHGDGAQAPTGPGRGER